MSPAQTSLCHVVGAIGSGSFAPQALAGLQEAVQAGSWSVYTLSQEHAPVLHLSAARHGPDLTRACFAAYARGLYLRDSSFDRVRRQARHDTPLVTTMPAEAAPNPEHREAIYRAHQLCERLSVAALSADGSLLAVNLYHHEPQGPFTEAERSRFHELAPLLHASVRRHLLLTQPNGHAATPAGTAHPTPGGAPEASARAALQAAAPGLTPRELDVCERLLRGWSHDGVAADLGLSLATVKTYRARAFGRLGIHFRSELFARFGVMAS